MRVSIIAKRVSDYEINTNAENIIKYNKKMEGDR